MKCVNREQGLLFTGIFHTFVESGLYFVGSDKNRKSNNEIKTACRSIHVAKNSQVSRMSLHPVGCHMMPKFLGKCKTVTSAGSICTVNVGGDLIDAGVLSIRPLFFFTLE